MRSVYYKWVNHCIYAIVAVLSVTGCSKMNSPYKDFIKDGVIIYPGIADSLTAHAGNGRIKLSWVLTDPKVTKSMVYWNQGQDSLTIPITGGGAETVEAMVTNLKEQIYEFTVYSLDKDGHLSVGSEVVGKAYGDRYQSSLVNRFIKGFEVVNGQLIVKWSVPDDGTLGEEITYVDENDNPRKIYVPVKDSAVIDGFVPGGSFQYRTLFIPDSSAIDTFYTTHKDVTVPPKLFEVEVDKSKFELFPLPGDYYEPFRSSNTVDNIWTNADAISDGGTYISKVDEHPLPQWFTIDLGNTYNLSRMKLFQRGNDGNSAVRLYAGGNVKKFEVWGSKDPDPNYNPDDHGSDFGPSWVLLQSCTVNRPSGDVMPSKSTRTDNTDEDIAAAMAGHEFIFNTVGKVRYIRIKVLENWDSDARAFVNIASIAFWKQ